MKGKNVAFVLFLVVLFIIIKIWIKNEKRESQIANQEIIGLFDKLKVAPDKQVYDSSYYQIKDKIWNYSLKDIKRKSNNVIAIIYDIKFSNSSLITTLIAIDSTAMVIMKDRANPVETSKDLNVIDISRSIFKNAETYLGKMELVSDEFIEPKLGNMRVYIRTFDKKTYVKEIDYFNDKDQFNITIRDEFIILWKAIVK